MVKSRKYDSTMVKLQQYDGENTILYRTIIIVLSYYRVFTILVSHYRYRAIAFSPSYFRYFVLSLSYYRASCFKLTHSKTMALTVFRIVGEREIGWLFYTYQRLGSMDLPRYFLPFHKEIWPSN